VKSVGGLAFFAVMASIMYGGSLGQAGGCGGDNKPAVSTTGVTIAKAEVKVGADGMTVEQRNVIKRVEQENDPASIKHLYVVSAMSGQCILYSTVKGKVSSSGKRLTPYSVWSGRLGESSRSTGPTVNIGGYEYTTNEVLQDDGTYGSSIPYLYWWDTRGKYHQHYVSGGQIVHVSAKPMAWKSIILNLEER